MTALPGAPKVFFTADTHFGHGGALGLFRRPFADVVAMNEAIIARWNDAVAPADAVWHLGDLAVRQPTAWMAALLERLNGEKHLVAGNTDLEATRALSGWASVQAYAEIEVDGTALVLCHYPLRSWNRMRRGALDLHGHSHGRLAPLPRQVDVGVDVFDFRPIGLSDILHHLRTRHRAAGAP